mmetsp:Transcript_30214/g.87707  ORF Transcript_30214/g.87707 Transcript_30214/m.87707 type:complete len:223 (-) Transcript_30214:897-1565(-)
MPKGQRRNWSWRQRLSAILPLAPGLLQRCRRARCRTKAGCLFCNTARRPLERHSQPRPAAARRHRGSPTLRWLQARLTASRTVVSSPARRRRPSNSRSSTARTWKSSARRLRQAALAAKKRQPNCWKWSAVCSIILSPPGRQIASAAKASRRWRKCKCSVSSRRPRRLAPRSCPMPRPRRVVKGRMRRAGPPARRTAKNPPRTTIQKAARTRFSPKRQLSTS